MRINLVVPFEQKDIVKRRGAFWDINKKVWYIENHPRIELFMDWMPKRLIKATTSGPLKHPEHIVTQPRTYRLKKSKRI
jgi:hypothetical protein